MAINEKLTCALSRAKPAAVKVHTIVQEFVRNRIEAEGLTAMMLLRLVILNQSRLVLDRPKGETIKHE